MRTETDTHSEQDLKYALIMVCKAVVYRSESPRVWHTIRTQEALLNTHLAMLGLELYIHSDDGYAFCRTIEQDDQDNDLPRLVVRRELSYAVSILLVVLRRKLAEHDSASSQDRLIVSTQEMLEQLDLFTLPTSRESRRVDVDLATINKVRDLGFLKPLPGHEELWEVRRVVQAFVDAACLNDFARTLEHYRNNSSSVAVEGDQA